MKTGTITATTFDKLASPNLALKPKRRDYDECSNCGSAALSTITGLSVKFVHSMCKDPDGIFWHFDDIVKFLKKRNYTVVEVTKNSVTNVFWRERPLTPNHCLLMFLKMDTEWYSAFVMHKNICWHNFEKEKVDNLFLINKPTDRVYIVHHKKWDSPHKFKRNL